jgi:hypothetical protein
LVGTDVGAQLHPRELFGSNTLDQFILVETASGIKPQRRGSARHGLALPLWSET